MGAAATLGWGVSSMGPAGSRPVPDQLLCISAKSGSVASRRFCQNVILEKPRAARAAHAHTGTCPFGRADGVGIWDGRERRRKRVAGGARLGAPARHRHGRATARGCGMPPHHTRPGPREIMLPTCSPCTVVVFTDTHVTGAQRKGEDCEPRGTETRETEGDMRVRQAAERSGERSRPRVCAVEEPWASAAARDGKMRQTQRKGEHTHGLCGCAPGEKRDA